MKKVSILAILFVSVFVVNSWGQGGGYRPPPPCNPRNQSCTSIGQTSNSVISKRRAKKQTGAERKSQINIGRPLKPGMSSGRY